MAKFESRERRKAGLWEIRKPEGSDFSQWKVESCPLFLVLETVVIAAIPFPILQWAKQRKGRHLKTFH